MGAAEGRHSPRRIRKSARLLSVAPTLTAKRCSSPGGRLRPIRWSGMLEGKRKDEKWECDLKA